MRAIVGLSALILLVLGVDMLAATASQQVIVVRMWPFSRTIAVAPIFTVLFGAAIAVSALIFWTIARPIVQINPSDPLVPRPDLRLGTDLVLASGIVIAVTAGALLILGVSAAKIELLTAVSVYGLGWLAAIATVRAVRDLDRSEGLSFDSYWGGLGGAQGGWRVSPTMVSLVLALVLIAGTVAVATGKGPTVTTNKQDAATANSADEEETASNNASADNGQ